VMSCDCTESGLFGSKSSLQQFSPLHRASAARFACASANAMLQVQIAECHSRRTAGIQTQGAVKFQGAQVDLTAMHAA
jgi:hypothetical protein